MLKTKQDGRISKRAKRPMMLACLGALVVTLAGCSTSLPANVPGLRTAVGNSLPGAKGETLADQDRIDEHVARACGAGVYTKDECARHTVAAKERRGELTQDATGAV